MITISPQDQLQNAFFRWMWERDNNEDLADFHDWLMINHRAKWGHKEVTDGDSPTFYVETLTFQDERDATLFLLRWA